MNSFVLVLTKWENWRMKWEKSRFYHFEIWIFKKSNKIHLGGFYSKSPVQINPWINPGLIRGWILLDDPEGNAQLHIPILDMW